MAHIETRLYLRQRQLRDRLLGNSGHISYRPARDLAARLLLHLDDPDLIWELSTQWLMSGLDVERADGGYAQPCDPIYYPGQFESVREPGAASPLRGLHVDNTDPAVRQLWATGRSVVFADIAQSAFKQGLKKDLMRSGAVSKIATALLDEQGMFGLLCIDRFQTRRNRAWTRTQFDVFESLAHEVLSPILGAAYRIHVCRRQIDDLQSRLTKAEYEVAVLAAAGHSYKEIARSQNKSRYTVDHQLRSIRRKLEIPSHAKLVFYLSKALGAIRV